MNIGQFLNKEDFELTKQEIFEKFTDYELPKDIDIRIIGSDLKMNREYIDHAGVYKYRYHPEFDRKCNFKDNPLILSYHYPEMNRKYHTQISDYIENDGRAIQISQANHLISHDPPFFCFYQADFETVGAHILDCYGSFEDFNIITNIPYGKQVLHPKRAKNIRKKIKMDKMDPDKYKYKNVALQQLFRRFGKF